MCRPWPAAYPPTRAQMAMAAAKGGGGGGGRGLHSSTFRLNVSAFYGIAGAFRCYVRDM